MADDTNTVERAGAYDMIDRFLRNNLSSDEDYAEYSNALDLVLGASLAASAGSEPVAWFEEEHSDIQDLEWNRLKPTYPGNWKPLYTHPSPPEGAGWRPIAEAPKDGTLIVLGARNGVWLGKYVPVYQSGFRPENPWSSMLLNHDHMAERYTRPTHWMPLPKAPAPPASEAKGA